MRRFFTADFHLQMSDILRFENRPFKTIEKHDAALLRSCCQRAKEDDTIIHVGDLYSFGKDRGHEGGKEKPNDVIKQIPATFVNIRGNHDFNNRVKSLCESMRINLGQSFKTVSVSHYPSYDTRAKDQFLENDIHICGHVHRRWKHCLDLTNHVLNINVGVDVWNYHIVAEDELIAYINKLLNSKNEIINKVKTIEGKIVNVK